MLINLNIFQVLKYGTYQSQPRHKGTKTASEKDLLFRSKPRRNKLLAIAPGLNSLENVELLRDNKLFNLKLKCFQL